MSCELIPYEDIKNKSKFIRNVASQASCSFDVYEAEDGGAYLICVERTEGSHKANRFFAASLPMLELSIEKMLGDNISNDDAARVLKGLFLSYEH